MGKKRKKKRSFKNSNSYGYKNNNNKRQRNNDRDKQQHPLVFNIPRFSDNSNSVPQTTNSTNCTTNNNKTITQMCLPSQHCNDISHSNIIMSYRGYSLKKKNEAIDRILPASITPLEFYNTYVRERRPVVFKASLETVDERWKGTKLRWSNEYLKKVAGNSTVRVEYREDKRGDFGQGKEKTMKMEEFLDLIGQGDVMHYLTTQDLKVDEEGRPEMMTSPIVELFNHGEFPLQPSLLPHLIPFNLNLWFGNTKEGSSSGLHHDFHDNLYILIRGKKRFRLYGPNSALNMYTKGTIAKVHENGRINYKGQVTRADGADVLSDVALNASKYQDDAERDLENAEEALRKGEVGAAEWVERAGKRLDDALDSVLSVQMDNKFDKEEDDYDDKSNSMNDDEDSNDGPLNFCAINLSLPEKKIIEQFPNFSNVRGTSVEVNSGEMLYLPAGWFHEVTSYSADGDADVKNNSNSNINDGGHMAFNYWFHPPDNLNDTANGFISPYKSNFWAQDFKSSVRK